MRHELLAMTVILAVTFFSGQALAGGKVGADCSFKGIPLYGTVQVVENFPDFQVRIVGGSADLDVQEVSAFPDSCGKWRFVSSLADFKVQFVDGVADFTIRRVQSFPGVR